MAARGGARCAPEGAGKPPCGRGDPAVQAPSLRLRRRGRTPPAPTPAHSGGAPSRTSPPGAHAPGERRAIAAAATVGLTMARLRPTRRPRQRERYPSGGEPGRHHQSAQRSGAAQAARRPRLSIRGHGERGTGQRQAPTSAHLLQLRVPGARVVGDRLGDPTRSQKQSSCPSERGDRSLATARRHGARQPGRRWIPVASSSASPRRHHHAQRVHGGRLGDPTRSQTQPSCPSERGGRRRGTSPQTSSRPLHSGSASVASGPDAARRTPARPRERGSAAIPGGAQPTQASATSSTKVTSNWLHPGGRRPGRKHPEPRSPGASKS